MDWNEWQLFYLILLDKLQCSSISLLLITQFLTQTGNHTMTPCSIFFLNWDLWLKDIIFCHKFWVFLVMDGMAPLFLSYKKFNIFALKMKSSIYLHCCAYVSNLNCFLSWTKIYIINKNSEYGVNDVGVIIINKSTIKVYSLYFEVYPDLYWFLILTD